MGNNTRVGGIYHNNDGFFAGTGTALKLGANGTANTIMTLSTAGNVGIGAAPGAYKLDVAGVGRFTGVNFSGSSATSTIITSSVTSDIQNTGQNAMVQLQPTITPSIDSTNFYGMIYLPTFANSSKNITQIDSVFSRTDLASTYTGTITTYNGFTSSNPSIAGGAISNVRGYYSNISAGSSRFNFYAIGNAPNYFAGNVGIGTTSPSSALDVSNGGAGLTVGADNGLSTRTNAVAKTGRIAFPQYLNANANYTGFYGYSDANRNTIYIGGGTNAYNAATDILFNTAPDQTTSSGTTRMKIDSSGNVGVGTTNPIGKLHVDGTIIGKSAVAASGADVDFGTGNMQYTTANCGAFRLQNLRDGGSYAFVVQGATASACSFTAFTDLGTVPNQLTVHMPPSHGLTTANTHTMYNLMVMGTHLYVSWTPGY